MTTELTDAQIIEKAKGDWNAAQPSWNCWDNFTERDHLLAVAAAVRAHVAADRAQRQAVQDRLPVVCIAGGNVSLVMGGPLKEGDYYELQKMDMALIAPASVIAQHEAQRQAGQEPDERHVMLKLANQIATSANPEEDSRLDVAYAISRHLGLNWPSAALSGPIPYAQRQAGQEPDAWMTEWTGPEGKQYFHAHASEVPAVDEARQMRGTCTPLYTAAPQPAQADNRDAEIAALKAKLEVDPAHSYDGIDCRDETIKMQDAAMDTMLGEIAALRSTMPVLPIPDRLVNSVFDGLLTDPKAPQFSSFNWFVAGTACAEEWCKAYIDAAIAQAVQPRALTADEHSVMQAAIADGLEIVHGGKAAQFSDAPP